MEALTRAFGIYFLLFHMALLCWCLMGVGIYCVESVGRGTNVKIVEPCEGRGPAIGIWK
jgi:hypothetical protein